MDKLWKAATALAVLPAELALAGGISACVDDSAFQEKGYAEVRLNLGGLPASGKVIWEVVRAENRGAAVTEAFREKRTGLSWSEPRYAGTEEVGTLEELVRNGKSSVLLVDILGERELTLRATWDAEGKTQAAQVKVSIGKGPLSRFKAPVKEKLTWLDFYELTNGRPFKGTSLTWFWGQPPQGGKMPTLLDMQSVSGPGKYNKASGFGAAVAAGWPTDARYWSGDVIMPRRSAHVDITSGSPHGHGGQSIDSLAYGAALME